MRIKTAIVMGIIMGTLMQYSAQAQEPNEPPAITLEAHWSIEGGVGLGASGGDLLQAWAMYWPDYAHDGAIGVVVIGGDQIDADEFIAGPAVEFSLGDVYEAVLSTVLPNHIAQGLKTLTAPVRAFGFGGLLFDRDLHTGALGGTGFHLWPNKRIQPTIRTEYILPPGGSAFEDAEGWWTFLDLAFFF